TSTLSLPNALAAQSGVYTLRARSFTTTVETTATITIVAPPVIDVAVGNPSVNELGTITLSVAASGLGLTYQWFKNNVAIDGQTTSQLAIPVATYLDAALYRVDITNLGG